MKRKVSAIVLFTSVLMWGCFVPQGAEYTDEMDLVATSYDQSFDFASKGTYSLPDEIVKITGDPTAPPEYIKSVYSVPMLQRIDDNMAALGYTKVDVSANPDIQLLPAAWTSTTIVGGYWGGYYCWYWPYYCGGGWYYPYYPTYTSYTTGTFVMTMVDPNQEDTAGSLRLIWTGAMNGLLSGGYEVDRINNGIDQAFRQSPYLKSN